MPFEYKRLAEVQNVPASKTIVFTNPSGKKTYIRLILIFCHNVGAGAPVDVDVFNVPDNNGATQTATDAHLIHHASALAADAKITLTYDAPGLILEDTADTIQVEADSAGDISVQIYGGQE